MVYIQRFSGDAIMKNENKKYKFTYIPNEKLINTTNQSQHKYTYQFKYPNCKFTINNVKYDMEKLNNKKDDFMALYIFIISLVAEDFNLSFNFKDNILSLNINNPISDEIKSLLCGKEGGLND